VAAAGDQGLTSAQVQAQRVHGFNDIVPPQASGWRVIAPARSLPADAREPARLGDALSWLAAGRGAGR